MGGGGSGSRRLSRGEMANTLFTFPSQINCFRSNKTTSMFFNYRGTQSQEAGEGRGKRPQPGRGKGNTGSLGQVEAKVR